MGVTLLTALEIQTNDDDTIRCNAYLGREAKLFIGAIEYYRNGHFHKLMLDTEPFYKSEQEALDAMKDAIKVIRATDLSDKGNFLGGN